ncbi:hypothetical protein GA0115234_1055176 [Streptomyces sp. DvalAA-43]|nr:hypothetical protein GA0115234_1055176 [Streptomyces sp. DvalAA-43]
MTGAVGGAPRTIRGAAYRPGIPRQPFSIPEVSIT